VWNYITYDRSVRLILRTPAESAEEPKATQKQNISAQVEV